ncbi:ATP-dependent 3'-5' DNA helicase [Malassezia nana]|uniref:ATP-dependent 3'-5' DNA helicase n=1 Tax=Malassezia nana TaxID=180528 RepID=A0AAF0J1J8_9BASI|nr:ATP-dependent 3'-5' DNA helicase [Malassezia nana]
MPRPGASAGTGSPPSSWPPSWVALFTTFKALCTVYTFLSAHRPVAPAFSAVQASVESLTKTPVHVRDLALIKAACPDLVYLDYVPTEQLESGPPTKKTKTEALYKEPTHDYTLVFEFIDCTFMTDKATSKRVIAHKRAAPDAAVQLISRRVATFTHALIEIQEACAAKGEDPVELLNSAADEVMPRRPCEEHAPEALPQRQQSMSDVLQTLSTMPWWREQIVPGGRRTFSARQALFGEAPTLPPEVREALQQSHGIQQLYLHQVLAIKAFQQGRHVIVSTGTSSGKSLVYHIPIACSMLQGPAFTAMCLFPTKALTQDQLVSMQRFLAHVSGAQDVRVATYDGDTPREERREIREHVRILCTNPDMLHQAILPFEEQWRRFLQGLRVVVLDELHVYTGIFGTHVALILRRLRRLCAALGNHALQFISCSATIAEPKSHMAQLFALDPALIDVVQMDGAPCGQKEWAIWNPPLIDPREPGHGRVSSYTEVSRLFRFLIQQGIRTIIFAKVRRTCEIILRQIREDLVQDGHADWAERVLAYRSGYSPQQRRALEQDMASGHLLGLVATTALELGVDIGVLDAVLLFGMPYSFASMWQQAGRAGRRRKDALVVLLGEPFPLDQYYMRHPELVFRAEAAPLWLDPSNELLMEQHVLCAAHEVPLSSDDVRYFGERCLDICSRLLDRDPEGFYFPRSNAAEHPATDISIRGARQDTYRYLDAKTWTLLEEVELERVFFEAYPGAIFLHQGVSYVCQEVDHDRRLAHMLASRVSYHTRPRDFTDVDACQVWRVRSLEHVQGHAFYGKVDVTHCVWGYYKVDRRATILDTVDVDAEPLVRTTQGLWLDVPWSMIETLARHGIHAAAAIHAAEHAVLSLTPLFVASASGDVLTECKVPVREWSRRATRRKRPSRLIFYDKPGLQAGLCNQMFEHLDSLIQIALCVIEACECPDVSTWQ